MKSSIEILQVKVFEEKLFKKPHINAHTALSDHNWLEAKK